MRTIRQQMDYMLMYLYDEHPNQSSKAVFILSPDELQALETELIHLRSICQPHTYIGKVEEDMFGQLTYMGVPIILGEKYRLVHLNRCTRSWPLRLS